MKEHKKFKMTRKERSGTIALLVLLTGLLIVWRVLPNLKKPNIETEEDELAWQKYKEQHLELVEKEQSNKENFKKGKSQINNEAVRSLELFDFDPNTATEDDLRNLGLSVGTAKTWIKYRSKGGKFYKKEDLKKLYTLSEKDYQRIAPFVRIEKVENSYASKKDAALSEKSNNNKLPEMVYLNTATAAQLMQLNGIGPAYSKRILEYRNALGGFISINQLKEIYGFPDSTFQQLKDYFVIEPEKIKKINMNAATEQELASHPYIQSAMAKNIVLLRGDLKNFKEITQLRQVPLINEEKFRKIAPYLHLE